VGLALEIVVVAQMRVHVGEPRLVAQRLGQRLRFPAEAQHLVKSSELEVRGTQVQADIDGLAGPFQALWQPLEHLARSLEAPNRFPIRAPRGGLTPGWP